MGIEQYMNITEDESVEEASFFGSFPDGYDALPTEEQVQAVEDLQLTMCGERGLGGAFEAAFQPEVEELEECPAYDAYIWSFVAEDPFVMCLMDPAHLRLGVECVTKYMEQYPVPRLYMLIRGIMDHLQSVQDSGANVAYKISSMARVAPLSAGGFSPFCVYGVYGSNCLFLQGYI